MDTSSGEKRDATKFERLQLEEIHHTPQEDPLISGEDVRVKRIKRKVDLRLSLVLALMYVVNQVRREDTYNYHTWNMY